MANAHKVHALEAVVGGPMKVVLTQDSSETIVQYTTSPIVQAVVTAAFLNGATIDPMLQNDTSTIRRVPFFEPGARPPGIALPDYYSVLRVATQRNQAGEDHLEVELKRDGDPSSIAPTVFDRSLQILFLAAFGKSRPDERRVQVRFHDDEIVGARLGFPKD